MSSKAKETQELAIVRYTQRTGHCYIDKPYLFPQPFQFEKMCQYQ